MFDPKCGTFTPLVADGTPYGQSWSSDGARLAFTRFDENHLVHVWLVNADGTGLTQLTNGPYETYPAISPDGSAVAFSSATHG